MKKHYSIEHLREAVWAYLDEQAISQTRLAKSLDLSQRGLNRFLNSQGGITLENAVTIMNFINYEPEEVEDDLEGLL